MSDLFETLAQAPRINRLMAALPEPDLTLLRAHLETVPLRQGQNLYTKDAPINHVYFVLHGVISLVAPLKDEPDVEIATVGPEGVVGLPVFLGAERPIGNATVQIPGEAERIKAEEFRSVVDQSPALNRILLRYTLALMNFIAQNAACNRVHSIEERCARWLLSTQDRVHEKTFPLTQEFLALMLGVRRPSVSKTAGILAKAGLISYVRGRITILNRAGLEAASCECYRVIRHEFDQLT
jgi:CRP-like cAMP-binding protein